VRRLCWIVALAVSVAATAASAQAPFNTYFLAVGSTSYIKPGSGEHGFETLPGANASARLVADILGAHGAAGGIVLTSAERAYVSRTDFMQALAAVGAQLKAARPTNPLLVVYFAGHGISEGIAWNHFSVPGNFVYGPPLDRLDIEAMAGHTIHAAGVADELDKLGVPYLLLLDTCYFGRAADLSSPILSPTALRNLSDVAGILRFTNEFHQPNPVVFSARPGTQVPLAPDPRDPDRKSLGPLARRLFFLSQSADANGGVLALSGLVAWLASSALDAGTSAPVTNATRPLVDAIVLGRRGPSHAIVTERQGTASAEDLCCPAASAPAAASGTRLRGTLTFEGPPGESISGGHRITVPANAEVEVRQPDPHSLEISFAGADGWELDLSSPGDAGGIARRRYSGAQRYPFQDSGRPGLSLTGAGKACNDVSGEFTVTAIQRDPSGHLTGLAADFSQNCDGSPRGLRGTIRLGTP
jgi:hypothetical protein